jgi:hypothetical protein
MHDARRAWRKIGDDEARNVLDCSALSRAACTQVRADFSAASADTLRAFVKEMGRVPTQGECDKLHAALVRHFNEDRIPLIVPEIVH